MSIANQIVPKPNGIAARAMAASGIPLDAIRVDGGTQSRASLYQNVVDDYAQAMRDGASFPPVVVFYDGSDHWLADGFHRFHAYRLAGVERIPADIRQGTRRDAILYSVGANETHGLRCTNEDKRRAVLTLLNDEEWSGWSDREISRRCAVSNQLVSNLRPSVNDGQIVRKVERSGTTYTMDTGAIGSAPIRAFDPQQAREYVEAAKIIRAEERSESARRENDFYPTPDSLIAEVVRRWKPRATAIWEPCVGDGRVADALRGAGYEVVSSDIAQGQDFFSHEATPRKDIALCTNPPFGRVREFIDHAFAIGVREMCLVLPERLWACGAGREQFERHRPSAWANMDWREDYLGKGGSPDRALAVAIWDGVCAPACGFEVWSRQAAVDELPEHDAETGEIIEIPAGSAASGQAALSGECPEAPLPDGASNGPAGTAATEQPETADEAEGDHLTGRGTRERGEHGANRRNGGAVERRTSEGSPQGEAEDAGVTGGESAAPHSKPQPPVPLPAEQPETASPLPAVSGTNATPATLAGDDGHPSIPTTDALAAGAGEQSPGIYAKSVGAVTINERCLKQATCKFGSHPHKITCASCNAAWAAQKAVAA